MLTSGCGRVLVPFSLVMTMAQALLAPLPPVKAAALPNFSEHKSPVTLTAVAPIRPKLSPAIELGNEETTTSQNEDPLNSPYPVPWNWVLKTQAQSAKTGVSGLRYYRSPALVSPDGKYAAYSRIEMRSQPELYASKVLSVMFLEDLKTGELQVIRANSPIAAYLENAGEDSEEMAGVISMLMPVSWSADSEHLLARQFEGAFSSSDVSDYGVIWNRRDHQVKTVSASPNGQDEVSAILLGWNQIAPDQVLFRASNLGDETEQTISVNLNGKLNVAESENAITYGQQISRSWTGGQAIR